MIQHLHQSAIFALSPPRQLHSHLPIVLKVLLLSVDNNSVIHIASHPPQQFQESIILLSCRIDTYRQWYL